MKISLTAFVLMLFSLLCLSCSDGQDYSYVHPDGWQLITFPGKAYRVARGEPVNGYAPTINVLGEESEKSLSDYLDENLMDMSSSAEGFSFLGKSEFVTDSGENGYKIIFETDQQGRRLHCTQYYIGNGEKVFVICYTRPSDAGFHLDSLCEASIRTFRFK